MKIFKKWNEKGPECPVCKTKEDKACALVPIVGSNTKEDPLIYESMPVHVDCFDLWFYPDKNIMVQVMPEGMNVVRN